MRKTNKKRFFLFFSPLTSLTVTTYIYNRHHRFLHGLYADVFIGSVEVDGACEDVGAGEAHE
jgi:hypothetical protein